MKSFRNKFIFIIIVLWIIIAFIRTGYNFSKLFTEERNWIGKTYEQKREMQFSDTYEVLKYINKISGPHDTIVIYSDDLQVYYFGRYYLYPRTILIKNAQIRYYQDFSKSNFIVLYPFTNKDYKEFKKDVYRYNTLIKTIETTNHKVAKIYSL